MEQGRVTITRSFPVFSGLARAKRECWLTSAFFPRTGDEKSRHDGTRQELGFDPCLHSHMLDARTPGSNKDAKRIWVALCPDGDESCIAEATLEMLRQRGEKNGLAEYLTELETGFVPLFTGRRPPSDC